MVRLRLFRRPRFRHLLIGTVLALVLVAVLDWWLPPPLPAVGAGAGSVVVAEDGQPLRAFAGEDGVWRTPVRVDQVSPLYVEALLTYEDRWFHRHPGVNPAAMLRAAWQGLRSGEIVSGGSTLSMQVARILEPPARRRSAGAKLRQILRALQLERRLSKQDILTLYLNHAPFGGPIEGVAAASWAYLGKAPDRLSHAEAALLAVLPQAPSRNRPDRHAGRARVARDKVLDRMAATGRWPEEVVQQAKQEPVLARRLRPPMHAALLAERLRRAQPTSTQIDTLIDADLQRAAEARVAAWLSQLPVATSAAVLIVEHQEMAVRAYVGSGAWGDPQRLGHVDMVRAWRSPGSTLKPLLYGLALDDGLIHSESLLVDAPQSFDGYRPANFDSGFRGPISAADALRLSLNVPAVDLLDRVGTARFAARMSHAGLRLRLPRGAEPNLAMILGGTATTLEDLVAAYTALARNGLSGPLRFQPTQPIEQRRLFSAEAAFIVREMLREPIPPGSAADALARGERLVAKTGTSWGYRDAWAIGVQPGWTLGVWVGRPDGTPMPGQYGALTALPLLQALAANLPRRSDPGHSRPDGVEQRTVCWPLGSELDPDHPELCEQQRTAWTLDGVVPTTLPDRSAPNAARIQTIWLDPEQRRRRPDCAEGLSLQRGQVARWPVLAAAWVRPTPLPAWASACTADESARGLTLVGLHDGSLLRPAPGGRGEARIRVRAHGGNGDIWWLIDDRLAGVSSDGRPQVLRFERPGPYRVVALDRDGSHASARIQVLP